MSDWKMQRAEVHKLISLYKENKCLWDYRSPEYKRPDLRKSAWSHLASVFAQDVLTIKKKIKHLRSAYVSEKKKVDELFGTLPKYHPNLFYFEQMSFLEPVIVSRKTIRHFENVETNQTDEDYNEDAMYSNLEYNTNVLEEKSISPPSSPQARQPDKSESYVQTFKKSQRQKLSPYYSKLNAAVKTLADVTQTISEESVYTSFGKTLALQLSQLSPLDATTAMSEIHQILSRNVIKFLTSRSNEMSNRVFAHTSNHQDELSDSEFIETVVNDLVEEDEPEEYK